MTGAGRCFAAVWLAAACGSARTEARSEARAAARSEARAAARGEGAMHGTVEAAAGPVAQPDVPPVEGPLCDGVDLDVVAACFRGALAVVGEDTPPEGRLIARAAGSLAPACAGLAIGPGGSLRTAGGGALRFERSSSAWDHHDDGRATRVLDYRISCECCAEVRSFSVEHAVGG